MIVFPLYLFDYSLIIHLIVFIYLTLWRRISYTTFVRDPLANYTSDIVNIVKSQWKGSSVSSVLVKLLGSKLRLYNSVFPVFKGLNIHL